MWRLGVILVAVLVTAATAGALVLPAPARTRTCAVDDTSRKEVLPGVTLRWDSSFRCTDVPRVGTYRIDVTVRGAAGSSETVVIRGLELVHTTPRPQGQAPEATAEASGLPMVVAPGHRESFTVSGEYELVTTDEGDKANLHLKAIGFGRRSGERFELGINVHLRG